MWKPNKNGAEPRAEDEALAEIQRGAFRLVYGFILQAVKGDKPTANIIFEDYLAGKSEELLSISRRCVSADQAGSTAILSRNGTEINGGGKGAGVSEDGPNTALS
jgi:hypothetical protein